MSPMLLMALVLIRSTLDLRAESSVEETISFLFLAHCAEVDLVIDRLSHFLSFLCLIQRDPSERSEAYAAFFIR